MGRFYREGVEGFFAPDPDDARRKQLRVTKLGLEVMRQGEGILERLRADWSKKIGSDELARLEALLTELVGDATIRIDAPGRAAGD